MATFTFTENFVFGLTNPVLNVVTIQARGMTGLVTDVSFTLLGLSHSVPDDLDMLLVAGDNVHNLAFWSDAGGETDLVNANITLSDSAAEVLPDNADLTTGNYRPADYESVETNTDYGYANGVFHAGPNGVGTFANAFSGINPNGNWQLRINGDFSVTGGSLLGVQLTVTSSGSVAALGATDGVDTLVVSDAGDGSGYFVFNGQLPVAYSGVSGFTIVDGGLGNDTFTGSSGNDVLHGGGDRDFVSAGLGNDILVVRDGDIAASDLFDGGGGSDTLQILGNTLDFRSTLLASLERVEFLSATTGTHIISFNAAQFGSGISLSATMDGNASATHNDFLQVFMGSKTSLNLSGLTMLDFSQTLDAVYINGDADAETITGTSVKDVISGLGGNDSLNGGLGVDVMQGGDGSDTYFANVFNDVVEEINAILAVGGNDLVNFTGTSGTFTLGANTERLTLGGTSAINGTGNNLSNTITGNAAANILDGGVDTLLDTLSGGLGNDTYIINSSNDNIAELVGGGTADRAKASVSFVLAAGDNIEFLETTNAALTTAINLTGNEIAQTITGNAGANILNGGIDVVSDTLVGGPGNDTYIINTSSDLITEFVAGGTADVVKASVTFTLANDDYIETMQTTNAALATAINLSGNSLAQTIAGNAGANILNGMFGNDILTGGLGADTFLFNTTLSAASNRDTITDFSIVDDTIQLENTGIFTALGAALGVLDVNLFKNLTTSGPLDATDRILYDDVTGALSYDADGSGATAAIQFATLTGAPTVTNADFFVV